MTLKDLQDEVDSFIGQYREGYWDPKTNVVCLAEEVGELAREINHHHGPKQKKDGEGDGDIGMELADILFIACCIANSLDIDLDEAWRKTMEKFSTRDRHRFLRK